MSRTVASRPLPFEPRQIPLVCENLKPPDPNVRISITIPARNEERRLPDVLKDLAGQKSRSGRVRSDFEVIVLVNGSDDATDLVARQCFRRYRLRGGVLNDLKTLRSRGVGQARRSLMEVAADRLRTAAGCDPRSAQRYWIGCTDADCRLPPDWITATDSAIRNGASVVAGHVEVGYRGRTSSANLHRKRYRYHKLVQQLWRQVRRTPRDLHSGHHFHCGASLALTRGAYELLGGIRPLSYQEDVDLWFRAVARGLRAVQDPRVRVFTSGRTVGRCRKGLASQLRGMETERDCLDWSLVRSPAEIARRAAVAREFGDGRSGERVRPQDRTTYFASLADAMSFKDPAGRARRWAEQCWSQCSIAAIQAEIRHSTDFGGSPCLHIDDALQLLLLDWDRLVTQ